MVEEAKRAQPRIIPEERRAYKKGSIQEHFMKLWRKLHQYARKWGWGRRNTPVKAIALGRDTASIDSILCKSDTKSEGILEKASLVKYVKAFMYCKNRRRHQHKSCRMQMQPEPMVTCKIEGKRNSSCLHHWCYKNKIYIGRMLFIRILIHTILTLLWQSRSGLRAIRW